MVDDWALEERCGSAKSFPALLSAIPPLRLAKSFFIKLRRVVVIFNIMLFLSQND